MLNISKQIYAGTGAPSTELQEAEIIPLGDSVNEKKKLESFTKRHITIKEFDNTPLPGFTLLKSQKRRYSSAEISWLIIDPRGFTARISSDNLEQILHVTGITECLIQQRCVWAREDSQTSMTLIPITDPRYTEAVKNTILLDERVDISQVQIGDTVMLQNELVGRYLGCLTIYGRLDVIDGTVPQVKVRPKMRRQIVEVEPGKYFHQIDAKILKIIKKTETPITKEEASAIINAEITNRNAILQSYTGFPSSPYSYMQGEDQLVSPYAVPKVQISAVEIPELEARIHFINCADNRDTALVLENNGNYYIPDFQHYSPTPIKDFKRTKLIGFDPKNIGNTITLEKKKRSYFNGGSNEKSYNITDFSKFYLLRRHVKQITY